MYTKEYEKRFYELFDKLVPRSGKCETLGGEMIRAMNRIIYRWWNDGDIAFEGYGRETVNPAVRFLEFVADHKDVTERFKKLVFDFFDRTPYAESDNVYDGKVHELAEATLECVEEKGLGEVPNDLGDLWDYEDPDEDRDVDEEDEEEEYWE